MAKEDSWFTETCVECGTAFALRIKERLHEELTQYQKIEIFATSTFGNLMTIDGFVMLTGRDNFIYHEMMSHPALFAHPDPQRVLVIGGGDCGTLREVLKHPTVTQAHQVEIDERVTRLAERYFPELCESNDDPRARLIFADGIQWVADAAAGSYDVVIIDSTDPVGQAARLFGTAFYVDCRRILGDRGVLIAQSESPLLHHDLIRSMHRNMRAAGFNEALTLNFPQCSYPSGWWSATMAGSGPLAQFRVADAQNKAFATRYYSHAIHRAALAVPPFLADALAQ